MDQLKIILEHRFWVLSGLAILIPPIGWWVSTGDMATKTDSRTKTISSKISNIAGLTKDMSTAANEDWIASAKQVNVKLAGLVDQTHKRLHDHQRPVMVWHPLVDKKLKDAQVKYRGETAASPQAFLDARRLFISRYVDMWQSDVYQVVEPFDMLTGEGKVWVADANGAIQITKAPVDSWTQRQMISAEEMWDAQEDLWMLHALMKAVARVNEGSTNIDDSRIKKLVSAVLRGGNPTDFEERHKKKSSPQQPGGASGPPSGAPRIGGLTPNFGGGNRDADMGPKPLPLIDPDDIFGSDEGSVSSTAANTKKQGAAETSPEHRYVQTDAKWRARGFVLRVVMDHQEIPKLLTVLTDAPFPVQIMQVEHQPYIAKHLQTVAPNADDPAEQKRVKANEDRLSMALNQVNLAEVLVAGTFTFYNEPAAPGAQPGTSTNATPASGPQPGKGAVGTPAAATNTKPSPTKSAPPSGPARPAGSSAKGPAVNPTKTPATPAGGTPAAKSPSASPPKSPGPPGSSTAKPVQPTKT
jgi:hypothetical protein